MKILNATTRLNDNGSVDIHCGPKWCLRAGVYVPISDVITTQYDSPTQTFRLAVMDEWLVMRPRKLFEKAAILRTVCDARHFGHVLSATAPASVDYEFAWSKGVSREADGFLLGNVEGHRIRLLFTDWLKLFKAGEITDSASSVRLDLTRLVSVAAKSAGEINLDPPVDLDFTGAMVLGHQDITTTGAAAWQQVHDNTPSVGVTYEAWGTMRWIHHINTLEYFLADFSRLGVRFDTIAYSGCSAATLVIAFAVDGDFTELGNLNVRGGMEYSALTATALHTGAKGGESLGNLAVVYPDWTCAVTAGIGYSAKFDLGVIDTDFDEDNLYPGDNTNNSSDEIGGAPTDPDIHLTLADPVPAYKSTMMMMGV